LVVVVVVVVEVVAVVVVVVMVLLRVGIVLAHAPLHTRDTESTTFAP
jgi:hypothetical protein